MCFFLAGEQYFHSVFSVLLSQESDEVDHYLRKHSEFDSFDEEQIALEKFDIGLLLEPMKLSKNSTPRNFHKKKAISQLEAFPLDQEYHVKSAFVHQSFC